MYFLIQNHSKAIFIQFLHLSRQISQKNLIRFKQNMGQSNKKSIFNKKMVIGLILTLCLLNSTGCSSTKGRVIQIDPNSVDYLANSFDQLLIFFLEQRDDQHESIFEEFVKDINHTFPNDHTLYAVTYFKNDTLGKLAKYNNKTDGFRIITRRNHYEMDFNHQIRQFQLLKKFYSHHVHPILPILIPEQLQNLETEQFLVMEYNSQESLKKYIQIYPKIYDFLKLFNVRALALQSTKNQTNVHIYKKSDLNKPVATYRNELSNIDELIDFVNVQTLNPLTKLNDQNYARIFGSFLDTQLLLIYEEKNADKVQIEEIRKQLKLVSTFNREQELKYQRILVAEASTDFLGKYFDQSIQELQDSKGEPIDFKIVLTKTDYGKFQLRRFNYGEETYGKPSKQNIIRFIEDVRMKKIDAQFKSQKVPTEQEQQETMLRKIVGKSFISQIFEKPDQSIVVLFIDSKDEESYKDVKSTFEKFTKKYEQVLKGKVVSAIFDLAKNQNKLLSIRTAPLLALFQKTNKKSPKYFKGYPKVESIKDWINYQVKDITIPQNFGEPILSLGAPSIQKPDQKQKITPEQL